MTAAAKWVTGVVAGGLVLGALLGRAADPEMKDPPPQWWQLTGRDEVIAVNDARFAEAWPDDLNPYGGYRPDLDYDAEVWALPIPDYDLAILESSSEPLTAPWSEPDDAFDTAENAAQQAEAAADDAEAAAEPAAETAPEGEPRQSELALAGLY